MSAIVEASDVRRLDSGAPDFDARLSALLAWEASQDAAIERQPGRFGQCRAGPHAEAGHHQVGIERRAALQVHATLVDRRRHVLQVEHHAVLFVQGAHEVA